MDIIETIRLLKGDKKNLLQVSLQYIQYEKNNIFKDVAKIHLKSAEQAFIAAIVSNKPELEIRVGIGHLRDAFNSYHVLLHKGRTVWGLSHFKWNDITTTFINLRLASIACVIALIYKNIGDEGNYISWKVDAVNAAEPYLKNRLYAVRGWQYAEKNKYYGEDLVGVPDQETREEYKKEVIFIDKFSKIIKEEI